MTKWGFIIDNTEYENLFVEEKRQKKRLTSQPALILYKNIMK